MDMINDQCELSVETKRRPATVTVTIVDDTPPGTFEVSSKDLPIKKIKHMKEGKDGKEDHMLTFSNYQDGTYEDGFQVTFELKKHEDYGFFVDDPDNPGKNNAICVKKVDASGHCPDYGATWRGFSPKEVAPDRMTLVVENPNDSLQYFGFALNFAREGETKPSLCFDPIGNNQNSQI
jgi:hypothetical protein